MGRRTGLLGVEEVTGYALWKIWEALVFELRNVKSIKSMYGDPHKVFKVYEMFKAWFYQCRSTVFPGLGRDLNLDVPSLSRTFYHLHQIGFQRVGEGICKTNLIECHFFLFSLCFSCWGIHCPT